MKSLFRKAATVGLLYLAKNYERVSLDFVKIRAASLYVKTVRDVRLIFLAAIGLALLVSLLVGSFLLLNIAIIWVLPITKTAKAIVFLVCMLVYFLLTLTGLLMVISQKTWMRKSKASHLVAKATEHLRRP